MTVPKELFSSHLRIALMKVNQVPDMNVALMEIVLITLAQRLDAVMIVRKVIIIILKPLYDL